MEGAFDYLHMVFIFNRNFLGWFGSLKSWSILSEEDYMNRYFFIVEDLFVLMVVVLLPTHL